MRRVLRAVGELLITVGLVVLLFAAYELWGTGLVTQREQRRLAEDLVEAWREPVPVSSAEPRDEDSAVVEPGTGIAVLRIPVLGEDWSKVVVEGTGREALKQGPGRMPGTGQLGAVGNAVVAGHRTTYGAPFADLDQLAADDEVIVETRQAVFTYRVYDSEVVQPTDVAVALPVPRRPGITPTKSLVTWLVVIAAVNTVISLFYYLRWVGPVFRVDDRAVPAAPERWSSAAAVTAAAASVAVGLGAGVVLAGVTP